MPTEQEALQALINRIQGEITALDARLRELKLMQHSARELSAFSKGIKPSVNPEEKIAPYSAEPSAPKGMVARRVREYVDRRERFTTSEVVDYVLQNEAVTQDRRHVYSAVYETLRRLTSADARLQWVKDAPMRTKSDKLADAATARK